MKRLVLLAFVVGVMLIGSGCAVRYTTTNDMCKYLRPDKAYALKDIPYNPCFEKKIRYFFNFPSSMPRTVVEKGTYLRCVNGKILVCFVGANIPCTEKANSLKKPNASEVAFCKKHPEASTIPAYITGVGTLYAWRCENGKPVAGKQIFHADNYGFIREFWQVIPK